MSDTESAENIGSVEFTYDINIRCPVCGHYGSKDRQGYCKNHDPSLPENNTCVQCGVQAYKIRDDYEGCPQDYYCKQHYEERCGPDLEALRNEFPDYRNRPKCEQCGAPAYKMDKNGYPYCRKDWLARNRTPSLTDRYIGDPLTESFEDKYLSNGPKSEFGIVKDKFDLER